MMMVLVVIADIVESRTIEHRPVFQRHLKQLLSSVSERSKQNLYSPYTLTLGDEFQAVYRHAGSVLHDLLEIITGILPYKLRVAVARGGLSTDINPKAALEMDGPAFADARTVIQKLKSSSRTEIEISEANVPDSLLPNLCLRLFANALENWNDNGISIFHGVLNHRTSDQIANILGITRRAVNKQIATNHIHDYVDLLNALTAELTQHDDSISARE